MKNQTKGKKCCLLNVRCRRGELSNDATFSSSSSPTFVCRSACAQSICETVLMWIVNNIGTCKEQKCNFFLPRPLTIAILSLDINCEIANLLCYYSLKYSTIAILCNSFLNSEQWPFVYINWWAEFRLLIQFYCEDTLQRQHLKFHIKLNQRQVKIWKIIDCLNNKRVFCLEWENS